MAPLVERDDVSGSRSQQFAMMLTPSVRAFLVIIDDTFGDPTNGGMISYLPAETSCSAKFEASPAHLQTWHDTSLFGSSDTITATVTFSGTQVSVYGILDKAQTVPTDLTFLLDGKESTPFSWQRAMTPLCSPVGDTKSGSASGVLLDYYITYLPSKSKSSTAVIIGVVLPSIVLLAVGALLTALWFMRRREAEAPAYCSSSPTRFSRTREPDVKLSSDNGESVRRKHGMIMDNHSLNIDRRLPMSLFRHFDQQHDSETTGCKSM
ncbi:hypothetical protein C8J56DRAFT_1039526 [Mycena floridula]|nr:hypothetical protein C8J56DRAFT_1039526 [Mycena floridula]